jgi:L-asparaginase
VIRTFGTGNAPQLKWFKEELKAANERGLLLVNITQCQSGSVHMGLYETSLPLIEAGVVSGYDSTPECAIAKLMFLLGHKLPKEKIQEMMDSNLCGEITK